MPVTLMKLSQALPVFLLDFLELNLLLGAKQCGDLPIRLRNSLVHSSRGLATNRFHVCSGCFDNRLDLCLLLIRQVQARLQTVQHMEGEFPWLCRPHERAPQPGCKQRSSNRTCEENEDCIQRPLYPPRLIHSRTPLQSPNLPASIRHRFFV